MQPGSSIPSAFFSALEILPFNTTTHSSKYPSWSPPTCQLPRHLPSCVPQSICYSSRLCARCLDSLPASPRASTLYDTPLLHRYAKWRARHSSEAMARSTRSRLLDLAIGKPPLPCPFAIAANLPGAQPFPRSSPKIPSSTGTSSSPKSRCGCLRKMS